MFIILYLYGCIENIVLGNGFNTANTSCGSGSTTETKPSSAILVNPLLSSTNHVPIHDSSPIESPDSTAKRTSFVSNYSKSSSNLTDSTKSSHQDLPTQVSIFFIQSKR